MTLFSEAELRVLKYGDRLTSGPGRVYHKGKANVPGSLGALSEQEARRLVSEGKTLREIAELAGVQIGWVTGWKHKHGLARPKRKGGAA